MFESSEQRRRFAAAAMQAALFQAIQLAIKTRRKEDGVSLRKLGLHSGRSTSFVVHIVASRNWRIETISNIAEVLGLRFEFAFVDRKNPNRRFTPAGVAYAQVDPSEAGASPAVSAGGDQPDAQTGK